MRDFSDDFAALRKRLKEAEGYLRIDDSRGRLGQLEEEASKPDLWDDQEEARRVTTELARVRDDVDLFDGLSQRLEDAETLADLAREEGDDSVEGEIEDTAADLRRQLDDLELRSLFSGEYDEHDAVVELHAGEGGTDAQDWANMMLRMYLRWAERRGFAVELDEVTPGQEAGILSATFIVRGRYAYGLLRSELGVHRLYRISPFDAQARRQTSYAALDVLPFVEDVSD